MPRDHPFIITGAIHQHVLPLTQHAQSLLARGIPLTQPNTSLPIFGLPPAASFQDLLVALKGVIVGQASGPPNPSSVAPLKESFERLFGPATVQNGWTAYSPRIADSLYM